ncbi:hypothetical protein [Haloarcula marina]|nr:hypothetical protein [Halomicroarcula marina]
MALVFPVLVASAAVVGPANRAVSTGKNRPVAYSVVQGEQWYPLSLAT